MKINEYLKKLHGTPVFRNILPMTQGALYPMFSVENDKLCAHFLTHKMDMTKDGIKAYFPEFYLTFTYPDCRLVKFERLAFNSAFTQDDLNSFEIVAKPTKEEAELRRGEISAALELAEKILAEWDENKSADVSEYNSVYYKILTEKQREVFKKL